MADLIRNAEDLIMWDELPMTPRYCVEALDGTLRDITRKNNLFGGKTILFSGNWRHIGPMSKGDTPTEVADITFMSSLLWQHINKQVSANKIATRKNKILNTPPSFKISVK